MSSSSFFFSSFRRLTLGLLLATAGCNTVVRKPMKPEFSISPDSLGSRIGKLVAAHKVNVNGEDVTTNGKENTQLQIDIYNGQHLSADQEQLRSLGLNVAEMVREALTNKGEFDSYRVVFVKVDSGSVVTKTSWRAFIYKATEL